MSDQQPPGEPTEPTVPSVPPPAGEPTQTLTWAAPPPASRPLPGSLLAAGVLLLVGATLAILASALILFTGLFMGQIPAGNLNLDGAGLTEEELRASLAIGQALVVVIGVVGLAVAAAHLMAGIGVLRRRGWARIVGLVLSVLGSLIFALGLAGSLIGPGAYTPASGLTAEQYRQFMAAGQIFGAVICGIGLAVYLFVGIVLARRGTDFA
jgi:hypothetical protein